jgi:hypothetical protein
VIDAHQDDHWNDHGYGGHPVVEERPVVHQGGIASSRQHVVQKKMVERHPGVHGQNHLQKEPERVCNVLCEIARHPQSILRTQKGATVQGKAGGGPFFAPVSAIP